MRGGGAALISFEGVAALNQRHGDPAVEPTTWRPPVLETVATIGSGSAAVAESIEAFLHWADATSRTTRKRHDQLQKQLLRLLTAQLIAPFLAPHDGVSPLDSCAQQIAAGLVSPHEMAAQLAQAMLRHTTLPAAGPTRLASAGNRAPA